MNLNVPTLPFPNKIKFEVVLPLKVPKPEIVLATPTVPIVNVLELISKISAALLKEIAFPPAGAETITSFIN